MVRVWETVTECPIHRKKVFIRVEADSVLEAKQKVLGMTIPCPWGAIDAKEHFFVVGFRWGLKEVEDAYALPEERLVELKVGVISNAPSLTPITPVEPTPLEYLYYVDVDVAEKQISKKDWWKK